MEETAFKNLIGKKIYVRLKSGLNYSGKVLDVKGDFVTLLDKFKKEVMFNVNEISGLEVLE